MGRPNEALERLSRNRRRLEQRLEDVRDAIDREVGWAPRSHRWVVPLIAFAAGVAIAFAMRRRGSDDRD